MNTRSQGNLGEDRACNYLISKGYTILTRNFRTRFGEIDIIAKDGTCIVFVEVKMRSNTLYGLPKEAITSKKIQKISFAASFYLKSIHQENAQHRIDAVEVEKDGDKTTLRHLVNVTM